MQSHASWMGHSKELWQNMVHWRRKRQPIPAFLSRESPEQYEKAKRCDTGKQALQAGRFNMLLGKTGGQLLIVMRWLDSITNSMSTLWVTVENRGAWCAAVHGLQRVATEQNHMLCFNWLLHHCKGETIIHTPHPQHTHTHTHTHTLNFQVEEADWGHAICPSCISNKQQSWNSKQIWCHVWTVTKLP